MRSVSTAGIVCVLAGCTSGQTPPQACTLIGCESGLEVTVENAPAEGFRVEATSPEQATPRVEQCQPAEACSGRVFFSDFTPESVTLRVIAGADTTSRDVRPEYQTVQPNGEGCPPTCRQAQVAVDMSTQQDRPARRDARHDE